MRGFVLALVLLCFQPVYAKQTLVNVKLWGSDDAVSITWEDNTIVSLDSEAAGGELIDGQGGYVTPGLIDSGSTVGIQGVSLSTTSADHRYEGDENTVSFNPALAFNPDSSIIPSLLVEGVTHAMLVPAVGKDVFAGQASLVDLSGEVYEGQGYAVIVYLGDSGWSRAGKSRAAGLQRLLLGLKEAQAYQANKRAYDRNQFRQLSFSQSDLEVLKDVLAREKKLVLYIDRATEILSVLNALESYELDIVLMGAREAWKVAGVLADRNIAVVLNALDNLPRSFDRLGARLDQPALLHKAGVKFSYMTEDLYSESRMLKQAAGVSVAYGLPWQVALDAMTVNAADIWGAEDFGALEKGMNATFVVWDGDPLEVTSQAIVVVVDGRIVDRTNRQDLLRNRYRDLSER